MKKSKKRSRVITGYIMFFLLIVVVVMAAVLIYGAVANQSKAVISVTMIIVIIVLATICTICDIVRRHIMVDKPTKQILEATDRIAKGDFTVEIPINRLYEKYDEYDRIKDNINKMAAELSKNEVLKTDFISNVSHELKTPLSIIQNYSMLIKDKSLSAEKREEYANTLMRTSKRLTDLIVNILKLNKLEHQEITPNFQSVRLNEILETAIVQFESEIEHSELAIECDLEDVTVITEPSYLEIVCNNLLSNAIKFTPEGGKITVTLKSEGKNAVISVADTGCGISAETGKRIFDKFYQCDTSHSQAGNGLGLALVKKVIDILGGEITVKSELGKGSTFTVYIKSEYEDNRSNKSQIKT